MAKQIASGEYAHAAAHEMMMRLAANGFIRVVNYHNTRPKDAPRIQAELAYFSQYFSPVTIQDLDLFFATRVWHKAKPGLIPAVYEGYRSHHDVMLPILEKYNFTGWFYLPAFFPDVPRGQQLGFCRQHSLRCNAGEDYPDGRVALNWAEVRRLSLKHEICCHTGTHFNLNNASSGQEMQREIIQSKQHLEEKLQKKVDVFCWLGGKEYAQYPKSHPYLAQAGYRYLVGNLKIQKLA